MEPIVLYSRVSTKDQDFEQQVEALKTWCKGNSFDVVASFGENISGYDPDVEREQYKEMKAYVLTHNIKNIAIWEMSRLSRSMINTRKEIDYFTSIGVNIHFKKEGMQTLSDNKANMVLLMMIAAMAEMERDTIVEKFARGKLSSILKGTVVSYSTMPYGYKRSDGNTKKERNKKCAATFKVDEEEAIVVRMMFEMAAKGVSLKEIARHLNSLGKPTRRTLSGKKHNNENIKWVGSVIGRCLIRTLYKGERNYKGNKITVDAIVTPELWDKVNERFGKKGSHLGYLNRKTEYEYLFKGKLKCGMCGRSINAKTTKQDSYYRCNGHNNEYEKCKLGRLNTTLIDKYVFGALFNTIDSEKKFGDDKAKEQGIETKKEQIVFYNKEIERLKKSHKTVIIKYTEHPELFTPAELVSKELSIKNQIVVCENKIKFLERELQKDNSIDVKELLFDIYRSDDYKSKRPFVEKYVDSVIAYDVKQTNIKFEIPIRKNEKILYLQLYAFNNQIPASIVISVFTKNVILFEDDNNLKYDNKTGILTQG